MVSLYVDDLLVIGSNVEQIDMFKREMNDAYIDMFKRDINDAYFDRFKREMNDAFEMTDLGKIHSS